MPPNWGTVTWLSSTMRRDRKSTRLNSSHVETSYAVFCSKKKKRLEADVDQVRLAPNAVTLDCDRFAELCERSEWTAAATLVVCDFFVFNETATTEIYTLSLHDALPILGRRERKRHRQLRAQRRDCRQLLDRGDLRSEEHTSELQSRRDRVCRLLLEKKKKSSKRPRLATSKRHRDDQ